MAAEGTPQPAKETPGTPPNLPLQRRKVRAALLSIVSNALLVVLKLVVGYMSGSVSVLSEAAHSATDLVASGIAFYSVRASDIPPDEEHPYGHGKIESISGLAEALLIFAAAIYIVYEITVKILAPENGHPHTLDAGLAVMGFSALTNFLISRYLFRVARETDSLALAADAEHLRADVLTSLGVLVGLALVRFTHIVWFDPITALVVVLLILRSAYRLAREALQPLLDSRLPEAEIALIRQILEGDARVLGYHKLRTRKSGSQRHADVHVQIEDSSTLLQSHDLAEELEDRIRERLPAIFINIHMEPYFAEMRHQQEAHGIPPPQIKSELPPAALTDKRND
ncbi:MAG TPA: cation diffusion facilitator family transporter [Chthonomonadaceae bacterium]|nr:cation diffusion facilitator family transporter [Chthonomonadaceae bacterium]